MLSVFSRVESESRTCEYVPFKASCSSVPGVERFSWIAEMSPHVGLNFVHDASSAYLQIDVD